MLENIEKGWDSKLITVDGRINNEANYRIILEHHPDWVNRIRYNEMKNVVEVDGQDLNDATLYDVVEWITRTIEISATASRTQAALYAVAKKNQYSPVRRYLGKIYHKWTDLRTDPVKIDSLASMISSDVEKHGLYTAYLRKFLMGAVMRAFEPGCKFDTMLILNGPQNVGKSSFFRLLGREWFNDNTINFDDKDSKIALHASWIHEDAELETMNRSDMNRLKAFITIQEDRFRLPYARNQSIVKRAFVLGGTTNNSDIFSDTTGSRRFWVIDFDKNLDFDKFIPMIDDIWCEATEFYYQYVAVREGKADKCAETPYLDDKVLYDKTIDNNNRYYPPDEWEEDVLNIASIKGSFSTKDILMHSDFDIKQKDITRREQIRVINILKKNGYENKQVWCPDGKNRRWWSKIT